MTSRNRWSVREAQKAWREFYLMDATPLTLTVNGDRRYPVVIVTIGTETYTISTWERYKEVKQIAQDAISE